MEPATKEQEQLQAAPAAWKSTLLPLAIFWILGVANLFHPLLISLNLGDVGDSRLVLYLLEHQYKVLTDPAYPGTYSTAPFWYPESENNMARSELLTGAEPLYFLPRLFLPRDRAFHAFLFLAATLNFLAFFWLCRTQQVQVAIAALAACLFAFGLHKIQHTVHAQFYIQFWGVFSLGWLIRFLRAPAKRALFLVVLCWSLQLLTSAYSGVFFLIGEGLFTVFFLLMYPRAARALWEWLRCDLAGAAGAVAAAIAPAIYLLRPYFQVGATQNWTWEYVSAQAPPFSFWFSPFRGSPWWFVARGFAGKPLAYQEAYLIGAVFVLLSLGAAAAYAFRPWRIEPRSRIALIAVAVAAVLLFLTMRWGSWIPWHLIYNWMPGAKRIRDFRRVGMFASLCCLFGGAIFMDFLARRFKPAARRILIYGCAAFALLENSAFPGLIAPETWRRWDSAKHFRFYEEFLAMYTYPSDWYRPQNAELAALLKGARTAYVFQDPELFDFVHEDNVQLVAQQLDIPVLNGNTASPKAGFNRKMRPREVLAKGTQFDFDGFRYLVPLSEDAGMQEDLRQAGLLPAQRGAYFAAYRPPVPSERKWDVEFRILDAPPERIKAGQSANIRVLLTNRGNYPWQPVDPTPTIPGVWIRRPGSRADEYEIADSTMIDRVIFPGDSQVVTVRVPAPATPGPRLVRLKMVQHRVRWFEPQDPAANVEFPITVE